MKFRLTTLILMLTPLWAQAARTTTTVTTEADLKAALDNTGTDYERIILGGDITMDDNYTYVVHKDRSIVFNNFKLVKGAGAQTKINYFGDVVAERQQIFSGWADSDIRGSFNTGVVYPEWWGLDTTNADVAINRAVRACVAGGFGNIVSLGSGTFTIRAPIDLTKSKCVLQGAGDGRTGIITDSATWSNASAIDCGLWGEDSHLAMVWIGNDVYTTNDNFRTGVRGVALNCYGAAIMDLTKRISGISSKGWVEENTIIEDVSISNFTGFGIGFAPPANGYVVVNGLTIRNFWITLGKMKDSYPLYFPPGSNVVNVEAGTLDMRVEKGASRLWDQTVKAVNKFSLRSPESDPAPFRVINPPNNTVLTVGGTNYTFKDTLTGAANEVKIDTTSAGVLFSKIMTPHPAVTARAGGNGQVILEAAAVGTNGNLSVASTTGVFTPDAAKLSGGTATAKASTTLTIGSGTTNPADGATVSLATHAHTYFDGTANTTVSGPLKVYTFRTTLTNTVEGEVKIGANVNASRDNLIAAISGAADTTVDNLIAAVNDSGGEGTKYGNGTTPNANVTAAHAPAASQHIGSRGISPPDGATVTLGAKTYTFRDTPALANDVQRAGKNFSSNTRMHPLVKAEGATQAMTGNPQIVFTAIPVGQPGHIDSTSTLTGGSGFGASKLAGGTANAYASGTLTFAATPGNGHTVTVGTVVYTFKTALTTPTPVANEVLIGGSALAARDNLLAAISGAGYESLVNLAKAINASGTASVHYFTGTTANSDITTTEVVKNLSLVVSAKTPGMAGNRLASTVAGASGLLLSGGSTLEFGRPKYEVHLTAIAAGTGGNVITATASSPHSAYFDIPSPYSGGGKNADLIPAIFAEWPLIAIVAQGAHTSFNNVHIEGTGVGVNVVQNNGVAKPP